MIPACKRVLPHQGGAVRWLDYRHHQGIEIQHEDCRYWIHGETPLFLNVLPVEGGGLQRRLQHPCLPAILAPKGSKRRRVCAQEDLPERPRATCVGGIQKEACSANLMKKKEPLRRIYLTGSFYPSHPIPLHLHPPMSREGLEPGGSAR